MGECCLPVLRSTHEPFLASSLPCPAEEGSDGAALVGAWRPAGLKPAQLRGLYTEAESLGNNRRQLS